MASSKPIFNAGTEKFVRDWRSAIVTVTLRDSRNRQHDPIIGVVPLKLSDILQTSSQVRHPRTPSIVNLMCSYINRHPAGILWMAVLVSAESEFLCSSVPRNSSCLPNSLAGMSARLSSCLTRLHPRSATRPT